MDVMLDLETMGSGPNAAIIAIGAVGFTPERIVHRFYRVVDLASSVATGGIIDASTVLWWLRQGNEARAQFNLSGMPVEEALSEFSQWLAPFGDGVKVWGNGAAFDNVILASAYRRLELPVPWKFYNDRCYRTMKAAHPGVKMERVGTYHNALNDAESQAQHLMAMLTVPTFEKGT